MSRLQDRVIIITGGGHGLGRAYCEGVVREGGRAVVVDVDEAAAGRVADDLCQQGGEALALRVDVAHEEETRVMAAATLSRFGRIDGLVNNAAVFLTVPLARASGIEEVTVEEWDRVMGVNVRGVFLCCKAVVPQMKSQGYGKIVNISSTTALQGLANFGPYPTSKAAVVGITRGLARDLGASNITVNAVAPGGTLSTDEVTDEQLRSAEAGLEMRAGARVNGVKLRAIHRLERAADLVGTVLFLCSSESDFISGQTIVVDGGSYMG
jgi:3-oxoacyl-[acyl-carrier protein] reductase